MTDMSVQQKIARPVINWLVETFFPNGAFYGRTYFDAFREVQKEDGSPLGQASVVWLVHSMHRLNAAEVRVEIGDMSICGEPVGDFVITGTLTKSSEQPHD